MTSLFEMIPTLHLQLIPPPPGSICDVEGNFLTIEKMG